MNKMNNIDRRNVNFNRIYIDLFYVNIFFRGGGDNVVCMVYLNFLFECNYDIK